MNRDSSIDISKGIGIILVVWAHQFGICPIHDWIYLFHMPLFFFLGGCFIKNESYPVFLYKKTRTLLVPFIFFYLSSLILKIILYRLREGNFDFMTHGYFFSTSSINFPLWFIVCLFIAINIYYFIRKFRYEAVKAVLVTVSFCIACLLYYKNVKLPVFLTQALLAIGFIYLGEKFYKARLSNIRLFWITLITLPFFVFAGIKGIKVDMGGLVIDKNFMLFLLPAFSGIGLTLLISRLICKYKGANVLQSLGRFSLYIFALHVNTSFLDAICRKIVEFTPPRYVNN